MASDLSADQYAEYGRGVTESARASQAACNDLTDLHVDLHRQMLARATEQWATWKPPTLTRRDRLREWVRVRRVRLAQWIAGDDWPDAE